MTELSERTDPWQISWYIIVPRHQSSWKKGLWNEEIDRFLAIYVYTLVVWNDDRRANLARRCMCMMGVV